MGIVYAILKTENDDILIGGGIKKLFVIDFKGWISSGGHQNYNSYFIKINYAKISHILEFNVKNKQYQKISTGSFSNIHESIMSLNLWVSKSLMIVI